MVMRWEGVDGQDGRNVVSFVQRPRGTKYKQEHHPPAPGLAFLEWRYPFKAESRRPRTSLRRQIGRYAGQQAATAGRPGPQQTPPNGGLRQPWHQMEADGSHPFVVARGQGPLSLIHI